MEAVELAGKDIWKVVMDLLCMSRNVDTNMNTEGREMKNTEKPMWNFQK